MVIMICLTGGPGCVVMVANMNSDVVVPQDIQTLFGVYGNVVRVKILFKVCVIFQEGLHGSIFDVE